VSKGKQQRGLRIPVSGVAKKNFSLASFASKKQSESLISKLPRGSRLIKEHTALQPNA
jgi:hypothetical protein